VKQALAEAMMAAETTAGRQASADKEQQLETRRFST